jgi:hypothetical protein
MKKYRGEKGKENPQILIGFAIKWSNSPPHSFFLRYLFSKLHWECISFVIKET